MAWDPSGVYSGEAVSNISTVSCSKLLAPPNMSFINVPAMIYCEWLRFMKKCNMDHIRNVGNAHGMARIFSFKNLMDLLSSKVLPNRRLFYSWTHQRHYHIRNRFVNVRDCAADHYKRLDRWRDNPLKDNSNVEWQSSPLTPLAEAGSLERIHKRKIQRSVEWNHMHRR